MVNATARELPPNMNRNHVRVHQCVRLQRLDVRVPVRACICSAATHLCTCAREPARMRLCVCAHARARAHVDLRAYPHCVCQDARAGTGDVQARTCALDSVRTRLRVRLCASARVYERTSMCCLDLLNGFNVCQDN